MALLIKEGKFGQVEPNHLSAQRNGQIYAQLPCATAVTELHNGQFVKYDYAAGECNFTGEGEFMLVFNEIKLYDPRKQGYGDFIYRPEDFTDKKMYPRVFKTMPGDLMTLTTVKTDVAEVAPAVGTLLAPGNDGILAEVADTTGNMVWKVVKVYTMADRSPAVKIQRVK